MSSHEELVKGTWPCFVPPSTMVVAAVHVLTVCPHRTEAACRRAACWLRRAAGQGAPRPVRARVGLWDVGSTDADLFDCAAKS